MIFTDRTCGSLLRKAEQKIERIKASIEYYETRLKQAREKLKLAEDVLAQRKEHSNFLPEAKK